MSVEENLQFFANLFGTTVSSSYNDIAAIYRQIEPFRKRRAGDLSGGMKQKLALSCALVHKPDILLLDEPTTGVDPVSRKDFWLILDELRKRGMTIIVATPYLDEVRRCNRIAFLQQGIVKGIGEPKEILQQFSNVFTPSMPKRNAQLRKDTPSANGECMASQVDNVIEVRNLVKCFGTFRAVDNISFCVHRGEIFGFLGANGAGKTTAMHILTGLNEPTSGSGYVAGCDITTGAEEIKKHIGYMSQKFSLYDDLSVRENIRLFAGIYGMADRDIARKTDDLLCELKFAEHAGDIVGSLPLGWKQNLHFLSVSFIIQRWSFLMSRQVVWTLQRESSFGNLYIRRQNAE